jgi:uncharacterized protein DUF3223
VGRSTPVEVAGWTFSSIGDFRSHLKKLLNELPQGVVLGEPHHTFLCHMVRRHPSAADKIGTGIKHFKVLTNANYGGKNRCFYLFRIDGTFTDFSYQKCVTPPTPWQEYYDALRSAVMDQIMEARDQAFGSGDEILCPIRNTPMTRSASHVDHIHPDTFAALVERFNDEEWLHEEAPPMTEGGDLKCGRKLVDKGLEERWRFFHRAHAKLRVISKEAHREVTVG